MDTLTRPLVEVQKFLDLKSVAKVFPYVSRNWLKAGQSRDLWWTLLCAREAVEVLMEGGQETGGWESAKAFARYRHSLFGFDDNRSIGTLLQKAESNMHKRVSLEILSLPCLSPAIVPLPRSYEHATNSAYLYLPVAKLFITGGHTGPALSDNSPSPTYLLTLPDSIQTLEAHPGVDFPLLVRVSETIYSFGSDALSESSQATDIWKYSLKDWRWSAVPEQEMSCHYRGWAELYQDKIYLIGGLGSGDSVDVFDVSTESTKSIAIPLPLKAAVALAYREGETLTIASGGNACVLELTQLATGQNRTVPCLQFSPTWQRSSPVVCLNKQVFLLLFGSILVRMDLPAGNPCEPDERERSQPELEGAGAAALVSLTIIIAYMKQGAITNFFKTPSKEEPRPLSVLQSTSPVQKRKDLSSLTFPGPKAKVEPKRSFPPCDEKKDNSPQKAEFDLPDWTLPEKIRDAKGRRPDHPDYDPSTLWVPANPGLTPAMEQYWKIKAEHYDAILMFKLGKFYELFYQDAILTQRVLELNWMGEPRKCHVGFPERVLDKYSSKLVELGYKVVVVEQTETPEQLKERNRTRPKGARDKAVSRQITEIYTKGTFLEEEEGLECRYLAVFVQYGEDVACVFAECSTGKMSLLECTLKQFYTAISQTQPLEFVYTPMYCEESLAKRLKELPSRPTVTSMKDYTLWEEATLEKHFPQGLPDLLCNIEGVNLRKAVKGTCSYLEKTLLAQKILPFAEWAYYNPSVSRHMILDFRALDALEILEVSSGSGKKREGSLLHFLDKTVTPFGKRLLKRWLCMPLTNISAICNRQDAVHELYCNLSPVSEFEKACKNLKDVDKMISKIGRYSCMQESNAIYFENIQSKQVKDFDVLLKQLKQLQHTQSVMDSCRFTAARLQALTTLKPEGGLFPDLFTICSEFLGVFHWTSDTAVEPAEGLYPPYDEAKVEENRIKTDLNTYLQEQRARFDGNQNISFVDIKLRYELEIPIELVSGSLKPKDYELTSARQGFQRFHTPAIKALVVQLEKAEEKVKSAFKPFLAGVFRRFLEKKDEVAQAIAAVGELDCLCSLAKAAHGYKRELCRPVFETEQKSVFSATNLRHPVLASRIPDFIPNDLELSPESPIIVLTGPNMGGKSTVLRQFCVAAILAQIGTLVPAAELKLSIVDRIFTRMGARDDLFLGKSTFAVEMEEAAEVFQSATESSLVIMDELGRGTGTSDGSAIAYVTLRRVLQSIACRMLFTTHYYMLADRIRDLERIRLYHMTANVSSDDVLFLYKLQEGVCPASFGLNVARLAGVPEGIIARAKELSVGVERDIKIRRILWVAKQLKDQPDAREQLLAFISKLH